MGKKTFALQWDGRPVLKRDKTHQEFLFEVRADTFQKCPVASTYWSYVVLEHLDEHERADLVDEAWATIVPKKASCPVLEATQI